jgi:serine O-acetyltransferase
MNAIGQAVVPTLKAQRLGMFDNIRADVARAALDRNQRLKVEDLPFAVKLSAFLRLTTQVVVAHRVLHGLRRLRVPVLRQVLQVIFSIYQRMLSMLTGVIIDNDAEIGPGLLVHTPYAVFVGGTRIGANCTVQSGVLIPTGSRGVGNNVYFGPGSKLLADTKVGNNVVIVANSLVLTDVPDNTTIVGVPARIKLRGGRPQRFKRVVNSEQ